MTRFHIGRNWNVRYYRIYLRLLQIYCLLIDRLNLYLQRGHKYLFSDTALTWQDARAECALYGGWLVNIGGFHSGVEEQNCLLRYGHSQGYDAWYWTDGRFQV